MDGVLFLALSCLQGRPMASAAAELLALGDVGLQLTPGCAPTRGFDRQLIDACVAVRTHHGYSPVAPRAQVWDGLTLLGDWQSVHPPKETEPAEKRAFREMALGCPTVLETMYPGYHLGTGDDLEWAMDSGLPLAVDVSHIFIQLSAGVMSTKTWDRLQEYDRIEEIHASSNDGRRDLHHPVDGSTWGLDWAVARSAAGVPLVLESYLHRQSVDDRRRSVDLLCMATANA
jgi:hypothetical protein